MLNQMFLFLDPKARMPVFNATKSRKENVAYGILEGYLPTFRERFEVGMGNAEYRMLIAMRFRYLMLMKMKRQNTKKKKR